MVKEKVEDQQETLRLFRTSTLFKRVLKLSLRRVTGPKPASSGMSLSLRGPCGLRAMAPVSRASSRPVAVLGGYPGSGLAGPHASPRLPRTRVTAWAPAPGCCCELDRTSFLAPAPSPPWGPARAPLSPSPCPPGSSAWSCFSRSRLSRCGISRRIPQSGSV